MAELVRNPDPIPYIGLDKVAHYKPGAGLDRIGGLWPHGSRIRQPHSTGCDQSADQLGTVNERTAAPKGVWAVWSERMASFNG